jgi:hypothetical protein
MTSNLLIGDWQVDPADLAAIDAFGLASLTFGPDGDLTYAVQSSDGLQMMLLTYRVEGDNLVTNQPSAPREERTPWAIDGAGRLTLTFGGVVGRFIRQT